MSVLNTTQLLLEQKQPLFINSDLYKQLNVKATILGSYLNGIKCYITAIKTYLRFIDVVEVEKNSKNDDKTIERVEYFNDNSKRFKSIVKR